VHGDRNLHRSGVLMLGVNVRQISCWVTLIDHLEMQTRFAFFSHHGTACFCIRCMW
jgi:hypothetical protein